jgi:site-specific DNA-methyltransferase (cytosine-N4-specific)
MTRTGESYALADQGELSFVKLPTLADAKQHPPAASLSSRLGAIQWDFPERVAHSDIEGLHPYPAKFVTELPRALLTILPVPAGTAVLDPFCGSGTTLVECQRRGLPSFGIDLNPIACLMARVKTAPVPEGLANSINAVMISAQTMPQPVIPDIPNLDHWFMPQVQQSLVRLTAAIAGAPESHRDILRLALSSIIVRVSNQDSDTRYAAVIKTVTSQSVFSLFLRAVQRIGDALNERRYALSSASVLEADTLAVNPKLISQPVSLVITSPPYPNAYEYWLYHKYRMWWLGFDPLAVKDREIGARAHFFEGKNHTADDFARQMSATFQLLREVMVQGGFACFVVGRSRIHGKIVDNVQVIEEVGRAAGFAHEFSTERVLSPNRKSFNLSHANIKTETVLVLRSK